MNYIIKKAGISMLTGAACTLGSWTTTHLLNKINKNVIDRKRKKSENCST